MTLNLLSPLDGRYAELTAPLSGYFSEFAFLRDRVRWDPDTAAKPDADAPLGDPP